MNPVQTLCQNGMDWLLAEDAKHEDLRHRDSKSGLEPGGLNVERVRAWPRGNRCPRGVGWGSESAGQI